MICKECGDNLDTDEISICDSCDKLKASYWQHRIKCISCGLHFIVCSNYEEWPKKRETDIKTIYCPECGTSGKVLVYTAKEVEGFIFQAVPGDVEGIRSYND